MLKTIHNNAACACAYVLLYLSLIPMILGDCLTSIYLLFTSRSSVDSRRTRTTSTAQKSAWFYVIILCSSNGDTFSKGVLNFNERFLEITVVKHYDASAYDM